MAYNKETTKVLSGSLSLLPPSDLVQDIDAIALTNWRTDTAGQIRSRLGQANVFTGLVNPVTRLIKALGARYQGVGSALFRAGVSVSTGFDGNPLGLASFKKYLWVMNKSKQGKDTGSAFRNWLPAAPSAAPTVAVGAEKQTNVETFETAASWTPSTGLTLANDAVDVKQGTNSLKCDFTDPGVYTFQKTGLALNLNSVGGSTGSDDDKHRIWIKVTDAKAVQAITLIVDVSAGATFDTDYYRVEIPKRKWKRLKGNWVQLEIRRANTINDVLVVTPAIADILRDVVNPRLLERESVSFGDLPTSAQALITQNALFFERFGATAGRDWATVTGLRIEIEAVESTTVRFDFWEVFGSVVGTIEGREVQYRYTYTTTDGHESNPSAASTATQFNRRSASVTVVASADAQVSGINIFRTGGTLGEYYLVNSTPEANTNHTFTDDKTDDDLTALGTILETDHNDPPAAAGLLGPYFGRLIAYNSTANAARFWWTEINKPWFFPGSAAAAGNWADIGDTGAEIVTTTQHDRFIYFYKGDSIWRLVGDPGEQDGIVEQTRSRIGAIGAQGACVGPDGDYFHGPEGIYRFNGEIPIKISEKIDPIFKGQTTTLATGITIAPITSTAADKATAVIEHFNNRIYFSYPESGQATPNITLVYNIENGVWGQDSRSFRSLYNEAGTFLGGTQGGSVVQLETTATDSGSAIAVTYMSGYVDARMPGTEKTWEDVVIEADPNGATLAVVAWLNNGASSVSLGNLTGTGLQTFTLQFDTEGKGQQAFNVSIRITGNTSAEARIKNAFLHYYPEARTANSFDSDELDLGTKGVKEIRSVELDIENANAANIRIYTDLPGNAMAERENISVGTLATRRVVPKMLPTRRKGYLSRFVVDGTGFQLYGLRAEVRLIGDYIIANETWDSDELDWGTERVKLIREFEIDFDSTADVTLVLRTDLPGGAIATRATKTVALSAGRQMSKVRLEPHYKGKLYQVRLSSTVDWTLYSLRAYLKMIGFPHATPWQWHDFPVEQTGSNVWRWVALPIDVRA